MLLCALEVDVLSWLMQYEAINQVCSAETQCYTCWPGANGCKAVTDYDRLVVTEHGRVSGMHEMKAELYKRGPISCVISATDKLWVSFCRCPSHLSYIVRTQIVYPSQITSSVHMHDFDCDVLCVPWSTWRWFTLAVSPFSSLWVLASRQAILEP